MSTRPQFSPYIVIPNALGSPANSSDMSADIISAPTIIQKLSMVSYALSWAGATPIGTVTVQVSNDYSLFPDGTVNNAGTWNDMPLSVGGVSMTTVPITGNSGNGFIDIDQMAGYAIRLIYTATSGTGNLQVIINGKVA